MKKYIFFIVILFPQFVFADFGKPFLYVHCENHIFELQPLIIWNEVLDKITPTIERGGGKIDTGSYKLIQMRGMDVVDEVCQVNDISIRVKITDNQIELFENGKLLSSPIIGDVWEFYGYIFQLRYTATTKWEEYCSCETSNPKENCKADWKPFIFQRINTNCNDMVSGSDFPFVALSNFTFEDQPMLFQTLVSKDAVCASALEIINNDFIGKSSEYNNPLDMQGKEKFITPKGEPYKEVTHPSSFDFDNDGIPDIIFSYLGEGKYLYGDIFYVAYGSKDNRTDKSVFSISDLFIFPCQFDPYVTTASDCPTISQHADEAGISVGFGEYYESVFFRGRYTAMTPIIYNNKTYIILRSHSQDTELYSAVIYPHSKIEFDSICLFKRQP